MSLSLQLGLCAGYCLKTNMPDGELEELRCAEDLGNYRGPYVYVYMYTHIHTYYACIHIDIETHACYAQGLFHYTHAHIHTCVHTYIHTTLVHISVHMSTLKFVRGICVETYVHACTLTPENSSTSMQRFHPSGDLAYSA